MSVVDDMTGVQRGKLKIIDRLKAEIEASAGGGAIRRSIKTEGERLLAYAQIQSLELEVYGEERTKEPSRHHG